MDNPILFYFWLIYDKNYKEENFYKCNVCFSLISMGLFVVEFYI